MTSTSTARNSSALYLLLILFMIFIIPSNGQTPLPDFWHVNGQVVDLVINNNYLYVGGQFTLIGPRVFNGTVVDKNTASPNLNFPKINGIVYTIVPDGAGGWYIGGEFTKVGDFVRNRFAHILSDNSVGSLNPDIDARVRSICVGAGVIYIGGDFSAVNGTSRSRIAAIQIDGTLTSWDPQSSGNVNAMLLSDTILYVGGSFTNIGTQSRNYIAALGVASGIATNWNPNANGGVQTLAIIDTIIYAGGSFTTMSGSPKELIAAIGKSGYLIPSFNAVFTGSGTRTVNTIKASDTTLYFGGNFQTVNGYPRERLAAFGKTGVMMNWNPQVDNIVNALSVHDDRVYIGGVFTQLNGNTVRSAGAVDKNIGSTVSWNPGIGVQPGTFPTGSPYPYIFSISAYNNSVCIGGYFDIAGGKERGRAAKIDLTTQEILPWNPSVENSTVNQIEILNGVVYLGGTFTQVQGVERNRLAAVDETNGSITSWNPNAGGSVNAMCVVDTVIYVGGAFTTLSGESRTRLGAVGISGVLRPWSPTAGSSVNVITNKDTILYVGGLFTNISGESRNRLAAVGVSGVLLPWNPNASSTVNTIAVRDTIIYVGGVFQTIGGETRQRLAAVGASGVVLPWVFNASGFVSGISIAYPNLYVGGAFTSINNTTRNRIASINLSTNSVTNWDPDATGNVYVFAIDKNTKTVYTGGAFTALGDERHIYLAAINDPSLQVLNLNLTALIEGFYDGSSMVSDTVTVELHSAASPYSLIDQAKVLLNSSGNAAAKFYSAADATNYYITVKHRNSIETWSKLPQQFSGGTLSYDFTLTATQAYGDNLKLVESKWCIYSGDVNQDGIVDLSDLIEVDNDVFNLRTGYLDTDLNGNGFINSDDLGIADNNAFNSVIKRWPGGTILLINTPIN